VSGVAKRTWTTWLRVLTGLPTASGHEHQVINWVRHWAAGRNLRVRQDEAGNLQVSIRSRSRKRPVTAVAHLDHPALVVVENKKRSATAELRGGVHLPYLVGAAVEHGADPKTIGRIVSYEGSMATVSWRGPGPVSPGDFMRWRFPPASLGVKDGRLRAHACDDLAGAAAALIALVKAQETGQGHFSVLLTRAEEVGFVGALAACELGTLPQESQILSIECSRASSDASLGAGPIVRVGDASSVFTAGLTNRVAEIAKHRKIRHERRLMVGGSCEATAFVALGWQATGLCLALANYHNMVDIDGVLAGKRPARLAPEEIDLGDFAGLVDLLVAVATDLNSTESDLPGRMRILYQQERHVLDS
jgi:endoglucanase